MIPENEVVLIGDKYFMKEDVYSILMPRIDEVKLEDIEFIE